MKYFGVRSLSSKIALFLNIFFYLSIMGTVVGLVILLVMRFANINSDDANTIWSFALGGLTIQTDKSIPYPLTLMFLNFFLALFGIALIYKLKNLFNNLKEEQVFIEDNFSLLRTSGLLLILLGFAISIVNFAHWNFLINEVGIIGHSFDVTINLAQPWNIISRKMDFDQYTMSLALISEQGLIIMGLSIVFFSHLFKKALELKAENDLTI